MDGVGGDEGLARAGGGSDEDRMVGVDGGEGVALEVVRRERESSDEIAFLVRRRTGREDGQRPASFPMPIEMK